MKKILYILLFLPLGIMAQTPTENYVLSKTYKVPSATVLETTNPDEVTTAIQYVDGLGRPKQSVLVKAGGNGNSYGNNELRYDWSLGTPSNSGFYNLNGSSAESQIVSGTTPFGTTDLLWECIPDGNGDRDGGFSTDNIAVDHTKAYRYTVWVKKTGNISGAGTSTLYGTMNTNNLDGTPNASPYFWGGNLPQLDTWYLLVGYIHASDYTGGDQGISGIYDAQGNKVLDATEFKWDTTTTVAHFRSYLYYTSDTTTRQYFWNPLAQKINGQEIALNDVITNTSAIIDNQELQIKDIVTHVEYDGLGRQEKEYLPYVSPNSDGSINTSAALATQNYYLNNYADDFQGITDPTQVNAFSQKRFEDAPLSRVLQQAAPGEDWKLGNDHEITLEYAANELDEVRYYDVSLDSDYTPTLTGGVDYYNANQLVKTVTKDENWTEADGNNHTTEEFTNKNGQVILKRTYNNNQAHDTFYIYDDYGNLTYVLPPKVTTADGISDNELAELCYQYKYDHRNRLVEKKIPGKGWEYIVYDKLDRPVLTQDANQRTNNEWLFTKYDVLGRVAYTGIYTHGSTISQTVMQSDFDSLNDEASKLYESRQATLGIDDIYYTNTNFPTVIEVLTVNYYDDYEVGNQIVFNPADGSGTWNGMTATAAVKGLPTVSRVRVLETDDWITTATYYDPKGRPWETYVQNDYLDTEEWVLTQLDFNGKALQVLSMHTKGEQATITTTDRFTYDHQDRLLSHTQKVNTQLPERIVRNTYDDLGQLESKLVGNACAKGYTDITDGIEINGDIITKTGAYSWSTGLATSGNFQGDGYLGFSPVQVGKRYMVGLSNTNASASYTTIGYAIYLSSPNVYIYESGSGKGIKTTYQIGDSFSIERIGTTIYYKKNGDVFYTSLKPSAGVLLGDLSMLNTGGQIKDLHIVDNSKGLQQVNYDYNVRGWLKNINEDTHGDNDLFNFTLRYNDATDPTKNLFNGNISQTSWHTANTDSSVKTYTYTYDALNRIKAGTFASTNTAQNGRYDLSAINYDKNGNITLLSRKGHIVENPDTNTPSDFGNMDNIYYSYNNGGNQLKSNYDSSGSIYGFKDVATTSGVDYTYDANGNMITDANKGINSITYNHLNLPTYVAVLPSSNGGGNIQYIYDATGIKQKKIVYSSSGGTTTTTEYAGNYIYENNALQFFNHSEGYFNAAGTPSSGELEGDYVYQYKDHLGNIRLSYTDADHDGIVAQTEIIEEANYYPFGLKHKGYNNVVSSNGNSVAQKYGFGGKELNDELGIQWMDFGARNYDASLGRWMNLDPLAEKYISITPYSYVANGPIIATDPDGKRIRFASYRDVKNDEKLSKQFSSRKEYRQARRKLKKNIKKLRKNSKTANKVLNDLHADENVHTIFASTESGGTTENLDGGGSTIKIGVNFGPDSDNFSSDTSSEEASILTTAAHEFGHAWRNMKRFDKKISGDLNHFVENDPLFNSIRSQKEQSERGASHIENIVRGELISNGVQNIGIRKTYSGLGLKKNYFAPKGSLIYTLDSIEYNLLDGEYSEGGYLSQQYKLNQIKK